MEQEKGMAGLNLFLSVIVMLFVIGLVIMIFSLMGGELIDTSYNDVSSSATNESITTVTEVGESLSVATQHSAVCTISECINATGLEVISSSDYAVTSCVVSYVTGDYNNTNWDCSYAYTYSEDTTATTVMNGTTVSLAGAVDWFPIVVVITAMIVLILLTVLIITSIRQSGLVATA